MYIILNGDKLKTFHLRSGTKQEWPISPLISNTILETTDTLRQENKIKIVQIGKDEIKVSLFTGDVDCPCRKSERFNKNPPGTNKILLQDINIQKPIAFLYTSK